MRFGVAFEIKTDSVSGLVAQVARVVRCTLRAAENRGEGRSLDVLGTRLEPIKQTALQQELDMLCITDRVELTPAAMIMRCFEGDLDQEVLISASPASFPPLISAYLRGRE